MIRRFLARRRPWRAAGPLGVVAVGLVVAQVVLAVPPTANFTISPTTAEVGDPVTFDASTSTDGDAGDAITTYDWDFDYDGDFNVDASSSSATTSHTYDTPGSRSVALQVTDSDADGAIESSTLRVRTLNVVMTPPANQPPAAQIACTDTVNPNVTVTCNSTGSDDPDGSIAEYEWSVDGGAFTDAGAVFTTSFAAGGTHTVRLRVRDNNGTLSPIVTESVTVNGPPTANIAVTAGTLPALPPDATVNPQLNQSAPLVGQTMQFSSAGSSDPGGSIASRAWDVDGNGFNDGTGVDLTHVFSAAGNQTVQLQVVDNNGAAALDSVSLRINSMPTADFITNDPTPVIDQSLAFLSRSSDPDNDITTYAWDFDNDGQFGEAAQAAGITCQSPTSANASCQFDNAGTYNVNLRITDAGGISRTATHQILIQSTVPSGSFSFSPDSPLIGQAATFSSTSTPTAGKQLTGYEWDFDYDGVTFTADAAGPSASRGFSSAGPKTVALRVSEAMPGGGPATGGFAIVSRTITVNAPPTAGMRISPVDPFVGDAATLSSTAADPDGPIVSHTWDLDGDGQFDDAAGPVVSKTYPTAGRRTVQLRVTDSKGAVATASGAIDVRTRPAVALSVFKVQLGVAVGEDFTDVIRLRVRAPGGTLLTVRCKGKGCPKRAVKTRSKGRLIRFKTLERRLRPGAKLIVTGTKAGFIGEQTTYTIRPGKQPKRVDRCLMPGAKKATRCPA